MGVIIMNGVKKPDKTVYIYIVDNKSPLIRVNPIYIVWDGKEIIYTSAFSENVLNKCETMGWHVLDTLPLSTVLPQSLPTVMDVLKEWTDDD